MNSGELRIEGKRRSALQGRTLKYRKRNGLRGPFFHDAGRKAIDPVIQEAKNEIGRCQSNSSQRGVFRGRAGYFRLRRRRQQQCRIPGVAATSATAPDNGRGSVINFATVPVSSYAIDMFKAVFNGAVATSRLLAAAGNPLCGVDTFSLEYRTVGGRAEPTNATAAVMVPRGDGAACSGARPVIVYNHGTIFEKATDLANWLNSNSMASQEAMAAAAFFAAQGDIVVAPN